MRRRSRSNRRRARGRLCDAPYAIPRVLESPESVTLRAKTGVKNLVGSLVVCHFWLDSARETTTFGHVGSRKTLHNGRLPTSVAP